MLTIPDICDKLKRLDEVTILELLEINSEEIVNRFQDKIEDIADYLEDTVSHCTSKTPIEEATCKNCGQKGHERKECPRSGEACARCNKKGHVLDMLA